jgi:replicative DNA helicase
MTARNSPFSEEVELSVLGTLLAAPSAAAEHADALRPDFFFLESNRVIAEAVIELLGENIPPNAVSLFERLKFHNKHLEAGDFEGIENLLNYSGNPDNLGHWLQELKRYWELRLVVDKCSDLAQRGRRVSGALIDGFLQEAESVFMQLAEAKNSLGLRRSSDILKETIQHLEKVMTTKGEGVTGVPTGFVDLDGITSGFQPSDLIILAARPAMGKTSLALNFASHAAIQAKKYVAVFSLEMSSHQLMQRMLSTAARIEAGKFRHGQLTSEELDRLYQEAANFNTDRLLLDDTASISLSDLRSRCRKMKRERGCDLIIIDYLQLMTAGPGLGSKASREGEVGYISRGLKGLAKELSCPVVALAQLNRGLEQRPDKRPKSSDLRESGSIEQDADMVMFVYRDEYYNKESPEKGIAELIIGKNRHGSTDTVKLAFQAEFTAFHNLMRL